MKTIRCKTCNKDLKNENYNGEEKESFWGKKYWVYWCTFCYDKKFFGMVNSDPTLKAKYYNIYGKSPEEVIAATKIQQKWETVKSSKGVVLGIRPILTVLLLALALSSSAQRWQDSNRGLYPESIRLTINGRNTAVGVRYSHLFEKSVMRIPVGLYGSFSQTVAPDLRFVNYDWERKYSVGAIITLPYDPRCMHTFLTFGVVKNQHPRLNADKHLPPGQHNPLYYETNAWGIDIGVSVQQKRFSAHIAIDAINFFRYAEVGVGYCFAVR